LRTLSNHTGAALRQTTRTGYAPTSLDAHPRPELQRECSPTIASPAAREVPSPQIYLPAPASSSEGLRVGNTANDTVREHRVQLIVAPGVYDVARW
jgi:hypothetical protein